MDRVRWLNADEQQVWRSYLAATKAFNAFMEQQLQRDAAMPATYYMILVELSEAPGRTLRMSELAMRSGSSRSRLSHAVARLEKAGWVTRSGHAGDKRGFNATLTDEGFAALVDAAPGHVSAVREKMFDVLTAEQVKQLGEICAAIVAGLTGDCAAARAAMEAEDSAADLSEDSAVDSVADSMATPGARTEDNAG
ncbi:MAG: MarR family transcriptional regulator [Sciscionella sp.]|nr:MarR family transcriptional regulator [Sciscionella sp.]